MNRKLILLSEKREHLVTRAAQQRIALRQALELWRVPLTLADRGIVALRYVKRHPQWMLGVIILLAVARPTRVRKWLERGLISWQMVKTLRASNLQAEV